VASSFEENLNFQRPKNCVKFHWSLLWNSLCFWISKLSCSFFCKQINYIVCQLSEKDHILLLIQIQISVVLIIHDWLEKRLFLSIIVYKKLHEIAFKFKSHSKFHGMLQRNLTSFFGLDRWKSHYLKNLKCWKKIQVKSRNQQHRIYQKQLSLERKYVLFCWAV
jgi:hypothetical protein